MTTDDASPAPGDPAGAGARARRAQRARVQGRRAWAGRAARPWLAVAALAVVAALVWAGVQSSPGADADVPADEYRVNVHKHAGFKVYAGQEEVSFRHCVLDIDGCREPSDGRFYQGSGFAGAHLHMGEPYDHVLHLEYTLVTGARNLTLRDFFEEHDMNITNSSLRFHDVAHPGRGALANNATHVWQLWVSHCFVDPPVWERVDDIPGYAPIQHDRFVLVFERLGTRVEDLGTRLDAVPVDAQIAEVGHDGCPRLATTTSAGQG